MDRVLPVSKRRGKTAGALQRLAEVAAAEVRGSIAANDEVGVCLRVARSLLPGLSAAAVAWVAEQLPCAARGAFVMPVMPQDATAAASANVLATSPGGVDPLATFYELFAAALHPELKRRRGIFYTPLPIVQYIVREVDRALREEFHVASGLLGSEFSLLDPALGAGLFLTEVVRFARREVASDDAWNEVAPRLIERLHGIEIVPAAACLAIVRMAAALEATGYRFESHALAHVRIGDALAAPIRPACSIIVGNPPFSGISETKQPWLHDLLHGRGPNDEPRASYFDIAGAPLGERKHWLQDDYVKFLRIAHEQIETAGQGIVALVTSHGYLDNITFRGLREKLAQTFPLITVIDLHGNAKRRERAPDGGRDENVFGIEQGVAIGLFRRPECRPLDSRLTRSQRRRRESPSDTRLAEHAVAVGSGSNEIIERGDLWGTKHDKFAALAADEALPLRSIAYDTPGQAFQFTAHDRFPEYDSAWPLDQAMPLWSTAPVTARDHFVVARSFDELEVRCRDFCDERQSDDDIRARYFTRTRSRRYPPGDTRGWKLGEARARMRGLDWRTLVRPVQYRPCDERLILWADWLVDWPRGEVTQHLLDGDNLALITRRQSPPAQPWNFAWIARGLALDGVIRSDNRGSEALFPLWRMDGEERAANFAPEFVAAFAGALGADHIDPLDLLHYIYALLHASAYRARYAQRLAADFPRVLIPRSRSLFQSLAALGCELVHCHLTEPPSLERAGSGDRESLTAKTFPSSRDFLRQRLPTPSRGASISVQGDLPALVAAGYPKHEGDRLYLNATCYFTGVSVAVIEFTVGSHRVVHKLLKDRRGEALDRPDLSRIEQAIGCIARTREIQAEIDRLWPAAADFAAAFKP